MDLESLYLRVHEAVSALDLNGIWPGFEPLKFALYDNERCFFDGRFVEKTDEFCANTSIVYRGEQIAIWMVQEELEIPVLASKLVHEMFHGFQARNCWNCNANELEALYKYAYTEENLSLKLRENALLLALLERFDEAAYRELLCIRKRRSIKFPYEFGYECAAEEIEGSANYVEWQALKQLDADRAAALEAHMRSVMTRSEHLFPIRICCYYTGALMINALRRSGEDPFCAAERPMLPPLLDAVPPYDGDISTNDGIFDEVSAALAAFNAETDAIIDAALEKNDVVLTGPFELAGVNVYNARCRRGFITSTYFLMYMDGNETKLLYGNFVIKMRDEKTIAAAYRWE